MFIGTAIISLASVFGMRAILDQELDALILNVASIQAASLTEGPGPEMRFHEWELTPAEAESMQDIIQYAVVWDADGTRLLRSRYMTGDLPVDSTALRSASNGGLEWREQTFDDIEIRALYYPLQRLGHLHAGHVLQVAAAVGPRDDLLARLGMFFLAATLLVTGASFAGGWWLAGRAVRPVHEVIDQAEEIGARSLGARIRAWGDTREYHRLVEVLNSMIARIHDGFVAQTRFTSDASHELRSPLTVLRGEIEIALRKSRTADDYRAVLESNLDEILRLSKVTEDLLTLARADSGALRNEGAESDVTDLLRQVLSRFDAIADTRGVTLSLESEVGVVPVDGGLFAQVVWNLVDNAIRHSPTGEEVVVRVRNFDETLYLTVLDRGPGLGENTERVFDRFFRADAVRTPGLNPVGESAGTGLGLAIVDAIIRALGGSVSGRDRDAGGAVFEVRIPTGVQGRPR